MLFCVRVRLGLLVAMLPKKNLGIKSFGLSATKHSMKLPPKPLLVNSLLAIILGIVYAGFSPIIVWTYLFQTKMDWIFICLLIGLVGVLPSAICSFFYPRIGGGLLILCALLYILAYQPTNHMLDLHQTGVDLALFSLPSIILGISSLILASPRKNNRC